MKNLSLHNVPPDMPEQASFEKAEVTALFGEILRSGLSLRVKVTGKSMAPFLEGGEVVTISRVPASELRRGDLIFFDSSEGAPVLHRIVRKKRSIRGAHIFQTRGDALRSLDGPVQSHEVLGRVCKIERPHPISGARQIEMDSPLQRMMNYMRAMINLAESAFYYAVAGWSRKGA